jgi:hypothetical protein
MLLFSGGTMRRSTAAIGLSLMIGLLGGALTPLHLVRAQAITNKIPPATDRLGDAAYTPTKLEWAALELQIYYGQNWTNENRMTIGFLPGDDGKTVVCLLRFTPDVSAETVKKQRDIEQQRLESQAHNRGWPWLRLQFQENVLPRP